MLSLDSLKNEIPHFEKEFVEEPRVNQTLKKIIAKVYKKYNVSRPAITWYDKMQKKYPYFMYHTSINRILYVVPSSLKTGNIEIWATVAHQIIGHAFLSKREQIVEETHVSIIENLKKLELYTPLIEYFISDWKNLLTDIIGFLYLGVGSKIFFPSFYSTKRTENNIDEVLKVILSREVIPFISTLEDIEYPMIPEEIRWKGEIYSIPFIQNAIRQILKIVCLTPFPCLKNKDKVNATLLDFVGWCDGNEYQYQALLYAFRENWFPKHFREFSLASIITATVRATLEKGESPEIFQGMISLLS